MPLPKPKKKEKQGDFISRCAGDTTMNKDFPETKQRVAVCYSQWKDAKASAMASFGEGDNEVLFECPECVEAAQKTKLATSEESLEEYKNDLEMEESEVDASGEDLTVDNLYIPEENEYVTAEEVAFDEVEVLEYDVAKERPGLWENIRKKKAREGKNYKPAKPGDKDRPSKEAWKKAQGAEYQGRKVTLNKPFRTSGGPKKFAVYTKNESGNVVIVRFGDPNMKIKKNIPERRKSFRARHNCDNPGPKWKARYWSCKAW